jgi:hypothetical protein
MTPLEATGPQVYYGSTQFLQGAGPTVAAEAAVQAAYPDDAA